MPAWPTSLPAPLQPGYGYQPDDPILRTQMQVGTDRTRRQASQAPTTIKVRWLFTEHQLYIFESWHKLEIQDGNAWFDKKIRTGAGAVTLECKFIGQPQMEKITAGAASGRWQVSAQLEIRQRPVMTELELAPYL